ncbi:SurA N-terminal domain-containing protein [Mesorhizobium sp. CAU 1741]|uniref:SurA N-terminal domain-containing protein n=1 Tax=Mesorhizobium sp. CAU 1741 TaxID=3140366 RepID=UPI00325B18D9
MLLGTSAPMGLVPSAAQASEIKYIVNNVPVTSYDIQRRVALLRLQNTRGNVQQVAADQLIDQTLRAAEMTRMNIRISDDQVGDAYERFARSNNMSTSQMDQVLNQSGVTKAHFREFIRSQMGWSQVLNARNRGSAGGKMSEQEVVQRMLQQGGEKPSATEYMLQQVIFVVPAAERGAKLGTRKREAEAMRQRFQSCESTREFARGLIDVTVRDLGRVLEPELPPDWAERIKATNAGAATTVQETERGVEFIGICSAREVSDDRVAQMVMQSEEGAGGDEASEKLTKELRDKAQIIQR